MAGAVGAGTRQYWYYGDNRDIYELRSTTSAEGVVTRYHRSILGPCPRRQVVAIARGNARINPTNATWQRTLSARLRDAQFETRDISNAPHNPEIGRTVGCYLRDPESWKTIGLEVLKIRIVTIAFFAPFREWRRQQALILTARHTSPFNDLIAKNPDFYRRIQEDPVLGGENNICPITQQPIRYPVTTPEGHLFEEGAIRGWLENQRAQGRQLTNPLNNEPLALTDLTFQVRLSDRIELRLLALEAFHGAE